MRKSYQSPGRMKNSSYYIAPVGDNDTNVQLVIEQLLGPTVAQRLIRQGPLGYGITDHIAYAYQPTYLRPGNNSREYNFAGRYFREKNFSREYIFAGRYFRVNSIFAKISSHEDISNSFFAKISSRENNVLYSKCKRTTAHTRQAIQIPGNNSRAYRTV